MKKQSLWQDTVEFKSFPPLKSDLSVDVLVIGAGITGILCAYELKNRGYNCIIVEQDKIASKTTKDTTAFITAQHETLYQDIYNKRGLKKAREYLELNLKAIEKYKYLSTKYDFDYEECMSVMYDLNDSGIIKKEKEVLEKIGYFPKIVYDCPLNIGAIEGIAFESQATINPLKLVNELSKELTIFEQTKIVKINKRYCETEGGNKIYFNKLIIATHYPIYNKMGLYFTKLTQKRSYVVAIEIDERNNEYFKNTYFGNADEDLYFRTYKNYLIIGGNDRDTSQECIEDFKKRIEDKLINDEILYSWSGQDCITLDGIPYIGRHNLINKNIYVATGFNLWGFTWAMASSFILADMIEKNINCELTSPQRFVVNKKLFVNFKNSLKFLLRLGKPRCKHLGCSLVYNKFEHTWECPCHGSRYDYEGNVLDGPSPKNIKSKNR